MNLYSFKWLLHSRYFPRLRLVFPQPDVKSGLIFIERWSFQSLVTDLRPHKQGSGGTGCCNSRMHSLPKHAFLNAVQATLLIDWVNLCFVNWSVLRKISAQMIGTDGFMGILSTAFIINNRRVRPVVMVCGAGGLWGQSWMAVKRHFSFWAVW